MGCVPRARFESQSPNVNALLSHREYTLKFMLTSLDKLGTLSMSVRATLIGEGGRDGLNVCGIAPVNATCR